MYSIAELPLPATVLAIHGRRDGAEVAVVQPGLADVVRARALARLWLAREHLRAGDMHVLCRGGCLLSAPLSLHLEASYVKPA